MDARQTIRRKVKLTFHRNREGWSRIPVPTLPLEFNFLRNVVPIAWAIHFDFVFEQGKLIKPCHSREAKASFRQLNDNCWKSLAKIQIATTRWPHQPEQNFNRQKSQAQTRKQLETRNINDVLRLYGTKTGRSKEELHPLQNISASRVRWPSTI